MAERPTKKAKVESTPRLGRSAAMLAGVQRTQNSTAAAQHGGGAAESGGIQAPLGERQDTVVLEFLQRVQQQAQEAFRSGNGAVEVELRLGIAVRHDRRIFPGESRKLATRLGADSDHNFEPGVSPQVFRQMQARLLSLKRERPELVKESKKEKVFVELGVPGVRLVEPLEPRGERRFESKQDIVSPSDGSKLKVDFALPSALHDCRLSTVLEKPEQPVSVDLTQHPHRVKTRTSFRHQAPGPSQSSFLWQIDLTKVEVVDPMGGGGASKFVHEVELELTPQGTAYLLGSAEPEAAMQALQRVAGELCWWLNPATNTTWGGLNNLDTSMPPTPTAVAAQEASNEVERYFRALAPGRGGRFPGAMPVNLSKHHIEGIQAIPTARSYLVTEKTDGVRQLLVAVESSQGPTCVLVDRRMEVRAFPGGERIGLPPGTILDGEVVFNLHYERPVFMVFDVLAVVRDGAMQSLVDLRFCERLQRLEHLKQAFIEPYAARWREAAKAGTELAGGIPIFLKRFLKRRDMDKLLERITTRGTDHKYKCEDVYHNTDGVIFQPDEPYTMGTDHRLLKWKWLDMVTVDMAVEVQDGEVVMSCDTNGGGDFRFPTEKTVLSRQDFLRLCGDMPLARGRCIAEVGLDPDSGSWFYKGLRPDKDRPNHLNTVIQTMTELAENMTEQELEYRMLSASPMEDKWDHELQKMMQALVQHRRDEKKQERERARQRQPT